MIIEVKVDLGNKQEKVFSVKIEKEKLTKEEVERAFYNIVLSLAFQCDCLISTLHQKTYITTTKKENISVRNGEIF